MGLFGFIDDRKLINSHEATKLSDRGGETCASVALTIPSGHLLEHFFPLS